MARSQTLLHAMLREAIVEFFSFVQFGHGSRTCIGKNISLMEMSKLIPQLVEKFDFQLADPKAELESENVWFVKQKNFMVKISERKT